MKIEIYVLELWTLKIDKICMIELSKLWQRLSIIDRQWFRSTETKITRNTIIYLFFRLVSGRSKKNFGLDF